MAKEFNFDVVSSVDMQEVDNAFQQARRELLKVNADLGRLGGMLKQALVSGHKEQIYGLLHKIDQLQASLKVRIRAL